MESAISAAIFCCYFLCNQWSRDRNIKIWFFLKMNVKKWKVKNQKITSLAHNHRIFSTKCLFQSHCITFTEQIYPLWYSLTENLVSFMKVLHSPQKLISLIIPFRALCHSIKIHSVSTSTYFNGILIHLVQVLKSI